MGVCSTCKYWKPDRNGWGECQRSTQFDREIDFRGDYTVQNDIKMIAICADEGIGGELMTYESFGCNEFAWIHGDY